MKSVRYGLTVVIFFCAVMGASALSWAQGQTTTFSAMGDVPYGSSEYSVLQQQMVDHNKYSPSKFQVHVGDIKSGSGSCTQAIYSDIANILKSSVAPVYIIPGDNETSDCSNPTQALAWWYQYYTNFEQNFAERRIPSIKAGRRRILRSHLTACCMSASTSLAVAAPAQVFSRRMRTGLNIISPRKSRRCALPLFFHRLVRAAAVTLSLMLLSNLRVRLANPCFFCMATAIRGFKIIPFLCPTRCALKSNRVARKIPSKSRCR